MTGMIDNIRAFYVFTVIGDNFLIYKNQPIKIARTWDRLSVRVETLENIDQIHRNEFSQGWG